MAFEEIKRIQELMKTIKRLQDLRKNLEQFKGIQQQQEMIRRFAEENKERFWRGEKPKEEELEKIREEAGYDKETWSAIVRELLGEPPPQNEIFDK